MRKLFFSLLNIITINFCVAQNEVSIYSTQRFSADTIKQVLDDVTKEISLKQPGFYRYNSKKQFSQYLDSVKSTIKDSLSELESYLKFKAVISNIHCLHTGITLPRDYNEYLNNFSNLIPLQILFNGHRAWIVKTFSNSNYVKAGDELKSINGQRIDSMIELLLPLIPSDGFNLTMKYRALLLQFPLWLRMIGKFDSFSIVLKGNMDGKPIWLKAAKYKELAGNGFLEEPSRTQQLEYKIENKIASITIHSFAKTEIEKGRQKFRQFIDSIFSNIKAKNITNLIVDLRDNTGGTDAYAEYFSSYFFNKPFRYWNRIEVAEAIANQIKGIGLKAFYRVPVRKDSSWIWLKARRTREFDFYETQKPAKDNYIGNTYLLINGFCMSSCADVAAILSFNRKVILIGEETGGGYQGNNSGMIPETKIAPFDFVLSVPLQEYFNNVDVSKNIGRGSIPDYTIQTTIDEVLAKKDTVLAFTLGLIKNSPKK